MKKISLILFAAVILHIVLGCCDKLEIKGVVSIDDKIIIKFKDFERPSELIIKELPPDDSYLWILQCKTPEPEEFKCSCSFNELIYGSPPKCYKQYGDAKPLIKGKEYELVYSLTPKHDEYIKFIVK